MSSSGPHRVARPAARYRPGKAPAQAGAYNDDEDESADESGSDEKLLRHQQRTKGQEDPKYEEITDFKSFTTQPSSHRRTAGIVVNIGSGSGSAAPTLSRKPQVKEEPDFGSDEYETDTGSEGDAVGDSQQARPKSTESESEYETDSEEGSSDEEAEEEPIKPIFKPMFVPRSQRQGASNLQSAGIAAQAGPSSPPAEDLEAKAEAEAQKRRLEAQRLAGERIKLELLEKQADEAKPDLDDTDDIDPEGEFAAWRLRELQRIKRQWEQEIQREEEEEERRAREAMTEEEKLKVDMARADETRRKKEEGRSKMGFMQKYYHKGAFFQDLDILKKRDYSEQTESAVDISKLPKVMQVRDYGKKSRSKYTHLADEDTTRKPDPRLSRGDASGAGPSSSSSGCFHCGSPDHRKKDCPVLTAEKEKEREERRRQFEQERRSSSRNGFSRPRDQDGGPTRSGDAGWAASAKGVGSGRRDDARSRSPPARSVEYRSRERGADPRRGEGGEGRMPDDGSPIRVDREGDRRAYFPAAGHRPRGRLQGDQTDGQVDAASKTMDRWAQRKEAEAAAAAAAAAKEAEKRSE